MTDAPGAFEKVTFRGKLMDRKTQAFLEAMEAELDYPLTVVQGCYNPGGVSASAGTHDGGGVVDLAAWDAAHKVRVAKKLGAFVWYRATLPGVWGEHIHLGIRDHGRLSPSAARQQVSFDTHRNGLANNAIDPTLRVSPPVTFVYDPKEEAVVPTETHVTKMRESIVLARHDISQAIAEGTAVDAKRTVAKSQLDDLVAIKKDLGDVLNVLPKK